MKDRLDLRTTALDNGITVFECPMDVPYAGIDIVLPVGHIHNTADIIPGTAHCLEHMQCLRSQLHPERKGFSKSTRLNAGSFGAGTAYQSTHFFLKVSQEVFGNAFEGLVSAVFEPKIDRHDLELEKGVIANERQGYVNFYPAKSKTGHYKRTKWKYDCNVTWQQTFGEDQDLEKITPTSLLAFQQYYFSPETFVLVGGKYNSNNVLTKLSQIKTHTNKPPVHFKPIHWFDNQYHEVPIGNSDKHTYYVGGIQRSSLADNTANYFIGTLLTNSVHGPLHEWLRDEKGWCYGLGFGQDNGFALSGMCDWQLSIPLSNHAQVASVRRELHERIIRCLEDKELLAREVNRRIKGTAFSYTTPEEILETVETSMFTYGRNVIEQQRIEEIQKCLDPQYLMGIYEKFWSPRVSGELLITPSTN